MMVLKRGAAVFLDRDGTLIRDVGYLRRSEEVEVLPKVPEALRLLRERGFKLVLVTNQSAIARGWLSEQELGEIHAVLIAALARSGARLDAIYYCPHHPFEGTGPYRRQCSCRKPDRGMIDQAMADLAVDPAVSYVVGDQDTDIALARRIGATPVLLGRSPARAEQSVDEPALAADLWEAARWIIEHAPPAGGVEERRS